MAPSIGNTCTDIHPASYAVKRWLRMSSDRLGLYPKAIYMHLGIDQGTWSRWTSYEHPQTPPSGYMALILELFDQQALEDLFDIYRPDWPVPNQTPLIPNKKKAAPGRTA